MADCDLIDAVARASVLCLDPLKKDAFGAIIEKGAAALDSISDDLTRELYSFLCGLFSGLLLCGDCWAGALLDQMQAPGVRGDPARMRQALKAAWK